MREKDFSKIGKRTIFALICYENKLTFPIYVSDQKFENSMDLLLVIDENKSHYVYIKDFYRFMLHKINIPVIFHNIRPYDSHLIFCELNKFDVKIDVIPNRLEKYMAFFLNKNLVFIDSMQFMNSSLEKLVKNLSDNDFKYLTEEFGSKNLELLKQKDAYPYEYMDSFKRFNEEKLPDKKCF